MTDLPDQNQPPKKKKKLDPNVAQRRASDPLSSVWVTASAGTGKTKSFTDRVTRILLHGGTPDQVLALTFTHKAAAIMINRVRDELAHWAICDDAQLEKKLKQLEGKKPTDALKKRARRLFAEFLDSNGAMRIMTQHSFGQHLLKVLATEADQPPDFELMDEQTSTEFLRQSWADLLRDIQKNPSNPLAGPLDMIAPEMSEDDFDSLIGEITYRRGQFLTNLDQHGGLEPAIEAVYQYLNAPRQGDVKQMMADLMSETGLNGLDQDRMALEDAMDTFFERGTGPERDKANVLMKWFEEPHNRAALFPEYKKLFFTTTGELRKKMTNKATSDAESAMMSEALRLQKGLEEIATFNVARGSESVIRLTSEILRRYAEKKRSRNKLDFDDLIYKVNLMMQQPNAAGWVLEKLQGNIKHVLVDEAQDTNPDQWTFITSFVQELFTGEGRAKDSTLFVVGDEKQSIFSFQRADPEEFGLRKKMLGELIRANGGKWDEVQLEIAFRSSPAITEAVDATFAQPDAADGLFFKEDQDTKQVHHDPFRSGQAGRVEVHPVIHAEPREPVVPWSLPLEMETATDPTTELAEKVADHIQNLIQSGEMLESRKRKISPSDIMILVRRRSSFVDQVVRALKKRDIPVAGADRVGLREQIVVQDLVALGEFLLFTEDDEKLACVLKSPLIGMNDQHLEDLAIGRDGTLWSALAQKSADENAPKIYRDVYEYLGGLQRRANDEKPYEFFYSILMNPCPADAKSGLYAIYSRLGMEAEDVLTEFQNAAEIFEKSHVPSLQGFIAWMYAGEGEVKREMSANPEDPRVQIMTVHGAKGLEAPIVIMPDTTGVPADNIRARPRFLWPTADRNVMLWVPRTDLENTVFTRERELAEQELEREYRRLLYVAMTRAEDRLYVFGSQNGERVAEGSWYSMIRRGLLDGLEGQVSAIAPDGTLSQNFNSVSPPSEEAVLRYEVKQTVRAKDDGMGFVPAKKAVGIPAWARVAPKNSAAKIDKLRPSDGNGNAGPVVYSAPSPLEGAKESYHIQLGNVVHELFEYLPSLDPAIQEDTARKYLAKPAWNITEQDQQHTLTQIMSVLRDPEFGALFGPNSRPEVTIAGTLLKNGEKKALSGQIDRLVVDDKTVTIVDFKNSRKVPATAEGVQYKYLEQLAAYRLALQQIYPGKQIKCALLYTRSAKLIPLPAARLNGVLKKAALTAVPKPPAA